MSPVLMRYLVACSAGVIAYLCVAVYAAQTGIAPQSAYFGGTVALIWCLMIYPRMGQIVLRDIYLTFMTFPIVGATTGTFFIPFKGTYAGFEAALTLPIKTPWPVGVLYLVGGALVFAAPRLARREVAPAAASSA